MRVILESLRRVRADGFRSIEQCSKVRALKINCDKQVKLIINGKMLGTTQSHLDPILVQSTSLRVEASFSTHGMDLLSFIAPRILISGDFSGSYYVLSRLINP